jgi:ribonuclease T1
VFLSGPPLAWQRLRKLGLAITVAGAAASTGVTPELVFAKGPTCVGGIVALADLSREAQATHERIRSGGPYPYPKDGSVFGNRELLLPAERRGYYREYTVKTVGAGDRGARRIVCGGREPRVPEACYYTGDHYASFCRIVQ